MQVCRTLDLFNCPVNHEADSRVIKEAGRCTALRAADNTGGAAAVIPLAAVNLTCIAREHLRVAREATTSGRLHAAGVRYRVVAARCERSRSEGRTEQAVVATA